MSRPRAHGNLLPAVSTALPGPASRALSARLEAAEAPGVNTLFGGEPALVWAEARGANVLDADGNVFLDLTSGFGAAAIGHRHPRVVAAVRAQSRRLLHALGDVAAHPLRPALAERLLALAPIDDGRVFFATSGSEAVEIALKTAILSTGRPGIVAFEPAYHGLTLGALAATSRPAFREPFAAHLPPVTRLPFAAPLAALKQALAARTVAAVVVEPIPGREGVLLPPPGWLAALATACREVGTLLVLDEIWTGLGRTGAWFVADDEGVRPDLLCCGKALGGGLPIAAVLGRREWMAAWRTPGEALHTSTFVGHPLACAAALAALDVLEHEELPWRARRLGQELAPRLAGWPARFPAVSEVRGRGLAWGIELARAELASELVAQARDLGVLLLAGGPEGKVAELTPPLMITRRQLDAALGVLERVLARLPGPH